MYKPLMFSRSIFAGSVFNGLFFLGTILAGLPVIAGAGIAESELPATSTWYFHADFDEMRGSAGGRELYRWLDREVFDEIRNEVGIDPDEEADRITAFGTGHSGAVVVLQGEVSQSTEDKLLALMAGSRKLDRLGSKRRPYYHFASDENAEMTVGGDGEGGVKLNLESVDDGIYVSLALDNKIVVASTPEQMESLLSNNGRLPPARKPSGTLFILSAEKSLVQVGLKPDEFDHDGNWDSNLLRNVEQVAVTIADVAGKVSVEAQLIAKEAEMAESLASIARGLISLQVFNDSLDPELARLLQGTRVDVDDKRLSISVALDPALLLSLLEN